MTAFRVNASTRFTVRRVPSLVLVVGFCYVDGKFDSVYMFPIAWGFKGTDSQISDDSAIDSMHLQ